MIEQAILAYLVAKVAPPPSPSALVTAHRAEVAEAISAAIWLFETNEAYLASIDVVRLALQFPPV